MYRTPYGIAAVILIIVLGVVLWQVLGSPLWLLILLPWRVRRKETPRLIGMCLVTSRGGWPNAG